MQKERVLDFVLLSKSNLEFFPREFFDSQIYYSTRSFLRKKTNKKATKTSVKISLSDSLDLLKYSASFFRRRRLLTDLGIPEDPQTSCLLLTAFAALGRVVRRHAAGQQGCTRTCAIGAFIAFAVYLVQLLIVQGGGSPIGNLSPSPSKPAR